MGEPVEQSAREAWGAEHHGPFRKRQRLEVLRFVQRVEAQLLTALYPGCCRDGS
jgi:hypothetical protein